MKAEAGRFPTDITQHRDSTVPPVRYVIAAESSVPPTLLERLTGDGICMRGYLYLYALSMWRRCIVEWSAETISGSYDWSSTRRVLRVSGMGECELAAPHSKLESSHSSIVAALHLYSRTYQRLLRGAIVSRRLESRSTSNTNTLSVRRRIARES